MSRLLVIEPNLMLRYALSVALIPDHLAQFSDELPDAAALKNVDGIVLDVAMLRQCNKPIDLGVVERWQVPTVVIDDQESVSPPQRRDWVTLKAPVQRERLLKAVFDCLNSPTGAAMAAAKGQSSATAAANTRAKKTKAGETSVPAAADHVIELVEVVDEPDNG
ncbi:MAG TPA: hypothetical protein VFK65_20805 [Candidatus Binatia bacterium]|nr:hypothetical protein [Candidatus Binatia bacterium]